MIMPRPYTHKRRKRSKWAAYNRRRAADLEADRQRRLANRLARKAAATDALIAEHERMLLHPAPVPRAATALRIRLRLEVVGHGSHQVTATWDDLARQWRPSKRSLLAGLAELLKVAPGIAAAAASTCPHRQVA